MNWIVVEQKVVGRVLRVILIRFGVNAITTIDWPCTWSSIYSSFDVINSFRMSKSNFNLNSIQSRILVQVMWWLELGRNHILAWVVPLLLSNYPILSSSRASFITRLQPKINEAGWCKIWAQIHPLQKAKTQQEVQYIQFELL